MPRPAPTHPGDVWVYFSAGLIGISFIVAVDPEKEWVTSLDYFEVTGLELTESFYPGCWSARWKKIA